MMRLYCGGIARCVSRKTNRVRYLAVLLLSLAVLAADRAAAQDVTAQTEPLKVGLHISPPFVMNADDGFTGMAVEIWEDLARDLNLAYDYQLFEDFGEMLQATREGALDVAVSNISITSARAETLEFTQPWFDAGLRIMVNEDRDVGIGEVFDGLIEAGFIAAYAWLAFVILLSTLLLTLFDRRFNQNFPKKWTEGTAESFYTVMSVATSGRLPSRPNLFGWIGRIMQAFWLICGIAVLAFVTSSVTSVMTVLTLHNQIDSLQDLPGKTVGVRAATTAEEVSRLEGLDVVTYHDFDTLVQALLAEEIDAIVADAPVLEYYAISNPTLPLDVVGPLFSPEKYGFAFPRTTEFDRALTVEILHDLEGEDMEKIRVRYFGDDP